MKNADFTFYISFFVVVCCIYVYRVAAILCNVILTSAVIGARVNVLVSSFLPFYILLQHEQ